MFTYDIGASCVTTHRTFERWIEAAVCTDAELRGTFQVDLRGDNDLPGCGTFKEWWMAGFHAWRICQRAAATGLIAEARTVVLARFGLAFLFQLPFLGCTDHLWLVRPACQFIKASPGAFVRERRVVGPDLRRY